MPESPEPERRDRLTMHPRDDDGGGTRALAREFAIVLAVFAVWRGSLFLLVLLGGAMTQERPDRDPNTRLWQAFPGSFFWDSWARWDSGWYMTIVEKGYGAHDNTEQTAAFFPLFPYATRALGRVVGNHWAAGLIISNVSLLLSMLFLGRIARHGLDEDGARRSMAYLLGFPASFFLSAYYSEGLFLLMSTAAFYYYLNKRYFLCGVFGALACMTRHIGLAVFASCAIGALYGLSRPGGRFRASLFWLLLMPLGTLAFMTILYVQVGDPLAFVEAHGAWGRSARLPHEAIWQTLARVDWSIPRDMMNTIDLMDALGAIPMLVLPLFLYRKFDPALIIYGMLLILVPLASGSVKSMMRCEAISFPAFLALARFGRNRDVDRAITFGMALFLGLLAIQFANWYWVG